ncbi:hypothetical protein VNO77_15150 [Canavalia gladiata]|uniref:Uncharacterized protein n=1 Tax=Canavalia gladiata TaxID=3824 RepID=A0AAN9QS86_CANGL
MAPMKSASMAPPPRRAMVMIRSRVRLELRPELPADGRRESQGKPCSVVWTHRAVSLWRCVLVTQFDARTERAAVVMSAPRAKHKLEESLSLVSNNRRRRTVRPLQVGYQPPRRATYWNFQGEKASESWRGERSSECP